LDERRHQHLRLDRRNQLATITGPVPASFVYDGLGRRMRKTINGTITDMLYDGVNPSKKFPRRSGNPADGPRHR